MSAMFDDGGSGVLQSFTESLPDAEVVPSGHAEHPPVPVAVLNMPASHAVHATPSNTAV